MHILARFGSVAAPVALVLIPIALGVVLRLTGLFSEPEGAVLRKFVVRFTIPIFVFFSLYEANAESLAAILPMASAFLLLTTVLFAVGWLASLPFADPGRKTAVHACVTFGNYGWMGLGVAQALLGGPGTQRVVYFILLWWPVFYGFGLAIGFLHVSDRKKGVPVRKAIAVAAPPILATIAGLALNRGGVAVPDLLSRGLKPIGDMTVPLILLSVGMLLDLRELRGELGPALLVSGLSLLLAPALALSLAGWLAPDLTTFRTVILEGAMPVATLIPALEENYRMDKDLVSTAIVLSTLLSLFTLPLVASLLLG